MWTMIAIGLVIVGLVLRGQTAARQDARDNRAEIAALRNDMNTEFKAVRAEINGLGQRIARLEGVLETLAGRRDAA